MVLKCTKVSSYVRKCFTIPNGFWYKSSLLCIVTSKSVTLETKTSSKILREVLNNLHTANEAGQGLRLAHSKEKVVSQCQTK